MPDHYFTAEPTSKSDVREISVEMPEGKYVFCTDSGVFSRDGLDPGSRLLIESAPALCGRVLDLGCGWGPVGVILARRNPQCRVVLSDVNQRAVETARGNLLRNGIQNAQCAVSDGLCGLEGEFDHILLNVNMKSMKFDNFWINQTYERAVIFGCVYYILSMDSDYPESSLKKIGSLILDERDKAYFNVFKNAADKARDLKETEIVQGADVVQQNVEASDGKRIILADKRYSDFTRIVQAMIQDGYFTHADKSAVTATEVGEMMLKLLGVSTSWKSMLQKAFSRDNPMKTFDNLRDAAQSYWQKRANI